MKAFLESSVSAWMPAETLSALGVDSLDEVCGFLRYLGALCAFEFGHSVQSSRRECVVSTVKADDKSHVIKSLSVSFGVYAGTNAQRFSAQIPSPDSVVTLHKPKPHSVQPVGRAQGTCVKRLTVADALKAMTRP